MGTAGSGQWTDCEPRTVRRDEALMGGEFEVADDTVVQSSAVQRSASGGRGQRSRARGNYIIMQVYQRRTRDWVVRGNGKVGKSARARPGQLVKYMFVFLSLFLFLTRSGA